jgi:hypothetical protein
MEEQKAITNKQELLKNLFTSFTTGIRAKKSTQPREWLQQRELSYNDLQIGFNSGQFHHRKDENFRQGYVDIGVLTESDAPVKEEGMKAYTCFGHYGIVFPLLNEHGEIVNLFAIRIKIKNETPAYLNQDGLYPCYPNQFTKRLFITETVMDAASLLQSKVLQRGDEVLALFEGEIKQQHIDAIKKINQLQEIIFIGKEITKLKEIFSDIQSSTVKLPDGHTMNDMLVNYQAEGINKLLEETNQANVPETPVNTNEIEIQEDLSNQPSGKTLLIYNTQKIGYKGQAGHYCVRGSLSPDLGNMIVTLQLEERLTNKMQVKKIDLFDSLQVQNYCNDLYEKSGLNANEVEADIMDLASLLSAHRDKQFEKSETNLISNRPAQVINHEKEKEAVKFLSEPKLLQRIDKLIGLSGVAGEENNRTLLYLCASTYKTNPLHVLVQSSSGSGKSHLINTVKDFMPSEDVINLTRVTSKSLYHYQGNDLVNKLIVIQDFDGLDEEAQFAFREAQSAKFLSSSTVDKDKYGNLQSVVKRVAAYFSSMAATTHPEIYFDNMSRSIIIGVDESEAQTLRIVHLQNKRIAGLIDTDREQQAKELLQNCIRVLKPYQVINRYADKIRLPIEAKMLRRLNEQFQNFIMQVTYVHQFQREIDDKGRVVTTPEDIKMAMDLFFDAIWLKIDELDSTTRQFFERMKAYLKKHGNTKTFTQKEIRQALNQGRSQCYRNFETLHRMEYISIASGTANRGYQYKVTEWKQVKEQREKIKQELYAQVNALR